MQIIEKLQKIYLKDYHAPDFSIERIELDFHLHDDFAEVTATSQFR